jgi:hypothetical protein
LRSDCIPHGLRQFGLAPCIQLVVGLTTTQLSTILPSGTRQKSLLRMSTCLPVGAMPVTSPEWVASRELRCHR